MWGCDWGEGQAEDTLQLWNLQPQTTYFFFPSCFQRQKVPWQLAFDKGTHGKAPARNMLLTKASYSPSPCNLNCLCKAGCGSLWLESQSWGDGGKSILSYRSSSRLAWTVWDPNSKQQSKTIVLFRDDFYNHLLPVFCGHLSGNPCFLPSRASCVPPHSLPGFHGLINAPFSLCPVLGKYSTEPRTLAIFLSHFPQYLSPSVDMFWPAMHLLGRERALLELDSWDKKVQIHGFSRHFFFPKWDQGYFLTN